METYNSKLVPFLDRFRDKRAKIKFSTWEQLTAFVLEHYDEDNLATLRLQIDGFGYLNVKPSQGQSGAGDKREGSDSASIQLKRKLWATYQDPLSWHDFGRWKVLWKGRPVESAHDRYGWLSGGGSSSG